MTKEERIINLKEYVGCLCEDCLNSRMEPLIMEKFVITTIGTLYDGLLVGEHPEGAENFILTKDEAVALTKAEMKKYEFEYVLTFLVCMDTKDKYCNNSKFKLFAPDVVMTDMEFLNEYGHLYADYF